MAKVIVTFKLEEGIYSILLIAAGKK